MSLSAVDEQITTNFKLSEFACRCGCGFNDIDRGLVAKLQTVRDEIGQPIKITSGCRCSAHNIVEGGEDDSSHLTGHAADISCTHSPRRMTLLPVLCREFRRVGPKKLFIHVDTDPTKDQDVLWIE